MLVSPVQAPVEADAFGPTPDCSLPYQSNERPRNRHRPHSTTEPLLTIQIRPGRLPFRRDELLWRGRLPGDLRSAGRAQKPEVLPEESLGPIERQMVAAISSTE